MLLSDILEKSNLLAREEYEIINEKKFETLGLLIAGTEQTLCSFLDDEKYFKDVQDNIVMVISTEEFKEPLLKMNVGICIVKEPRILFFRLHNLLAEDEGYRRKSVKSVIGNGCRIAKEAVISENNVFIGDNVVIEEFVVIRENTVIGDNTIIRAGVKIGGEGFEFKKADGRVEAVKHTGGVVIGRNVEIQYNTCIDKAIYPWDNTVVGNNTKIDNLVHIGHAVKLDERIIVVAQSGVGGRTVIGSDAWLGFGTTISNGLHIGCSTRANIGAVVTKSVSDNESVTGNFAIEHKRFIENLKSISKPQ